MSLSGGGLVPGKNDSGGGFDMGALSIFTTFLGAGVSAGASVAAGNSMKALNEYNARIAELKADDAIVRGGEEEHRLRQSAKGMIGASRAAFAASGVEVNDADSTAGNVASDIAALSEIDALTIRSNAAREAWGYRSQATDFRARGAIAKAEGDMKAIGTLTSAAGSVLYQKYGFGSTTRVRA